MTDDHTPSALERISAPWLVRLSRIPRWLFLIVLGSVLFAGLYLDSALGGVLLLVLALFLAWLASVGWSHVSPLGASCGFSRSGSWSTWRSTSSAKRF